MPRATADLDVTVLVGDTPTEELVARLNQSHFDLKFGDPDFIARTQVLALIHRPSSFPVDVVLGKPGLEQIFVDGARPVRVGRRNVPVASATHLLVMKLLAARPKDLEDAATLIRVQPDGLDVDAAARLTASKPTANEMPEHVAPACGSSALRSNAGGRAWRPSAIRTPLSPAPWRTDFVETLAMLTEGRPPLPESKLCAQGTSCLAHARIGRRGAAEGRRPLERSRPPMVVGLGWVAAEGQTSRESAVLALARLTLHLRRREELIAPSCRKTTL